MKKLYTISILFVVLGVSGCKKDHTPKDMDHDPWASPECPVENAQLTAEMIITGNDTIIYDFIYDSAGRMVTVQNRNTSFPVKSITYIDAKHYLQTAYNSDGSYLYSGLVSLDEEMKMKEIMIYLNSDTSTINKVTYDYVGKQLKLRKGYEASKAENYAHWNNYDSIFYNWTGNNLTHMTSYYEHKLSLEQSFEYITDSRCFLQEYIQPFSSFGLEHPNSDGSIKSKNFVRKIETKSYGIIMGYPDSTIYEPVFDAGDKLIRVTESNYYAGNVLRSNKKFFLYTCK